MNTTTRILLILAATTGALNIAATTRPTSAETLPPQDAAPPHAEPATITVPAALPAITRPHRAAAITAPNALPITDILARTGQHVATGQPIIALDAQTAQATLDIAEARARQTAPVRIARANLDFAKIRLEQLEKASTEGVAGDLEVLRAAADVERFHAELDLAEEQAEIAALEAHRARLDLERLTLRAPFDGTIASVDAELGEPATTQAPLFQIVDLSELVVDIYLPADAALALTTGDEYTLHALAPIGRPITATLDAVVPTIDPAAQTVRCIFRIDNPLAALPAGFHVATTRPSQDAPAQAFSRFDAAP